MSFIDSIKAIDTELFLFLNSKHNSCFDFIMFWASNKLIWIPLYIFFGYLALKYFRRRLVLILLSTFLLIVLTDQVSNRVFKNNFERYRPCHNLIIQSQVHVNRECGGMFGFISSHATNTFGLAMFLSLLFYKHIKYFPLFIFLWAAFISYSRIYNGAHYPADVSVGALVGMSLGFTTYKWYSFIDRKLTSS